MGIRSKVCITVPYDRYVELRGLFGSGTPDEQALMRFMDRLWRHETGDGRTYVTMEWDGIKWYDTYDEIARLAAWVREGTYRYVQLVEYEDEIISESPDFPDGLRYAVAIVKDIEVDGTETSDDELRKPTMCETQQEENRDE